MDPSTIDAIGKYFGLDPVTLGLFPVIAVTAASLLKEYGLRGKPILVVIAAVCAFLNWYAYRPAAATIAIGSLICFLIAAGGYSTVKGLVNKHAAKIAAGGGSNETSVKAPVDAGSSADAAAAGDSVVRGPVWPRRRRDVSGER